MNSMQLASTASVLRMANKKAGRSDETLDQLAVRLEAAMQSADAEEQQELDEYLCAVESAASELGSYSHQVEDAALILDLRAGNGKPVAVAFASAASFAVPIAILSTVLS